MCQDGSVSVSCCDRCGSDNSVVMEESSTSLMRVHGVRGAIDEEDAIRRLIAAAVPSNTATVEEVEDDDDDAASCGGEIQLGFVESVDPGEEYIFLPEYFPSKVGGKPVRAAPHHCLRAIQCKRE